MSPQKMLAYLNIGHFLDHYFLMIFPLAVLAIERQWKLDYADALTLGTPLYVGFALGTLPAGWLGDVCKRGHLIAVLFIGSGISSVGIAFAPGPFWLMAGLGGLGLFVSIYHPVGLSLVTGLSDRPGRALAVNGVYGNLGLAAASLVTGVLAEFAGWRSAFLIPGLVALVVGGFYCLAYRSGAELSTTAKPTAMHPPPVTERSNRYRVVAVVMVAALFGGLIFNGVTISLPKLFELRLSGFVDRLAGVGAYSALVFTFAAFAQLPVGAMLDRVGAKPILVVILLLQAIALLAIANAQGIAVIPVAMILVLLMFAELPITGWLVGRYISTRWRARVFAVEYVLSLGMSALIVPLIATLYAWGVGFDQLYAGFAVSAVVVLVAALGLPRLNLQHSVPASTKPEKRG